MAVIAQVLLAISGISMMAYTPILGAEPRFQASQHSHIRLLLLFSGGAVCLAAAFSDFARASLLPAIAGVWLLQDAALLIGTHNRMTWVQRLATIRDLEPVKPVQESTPAYIGATGVIVDGPNADVVRQELKARGYAPRVQEIRPGWFVGGDDEFLSWLARRDPNTRTFTWSGGPITTGRLVWNTALPSRTRGMLEALTGICILIAVLPSPIQTNATMVRDRTLYGFGTLLLALGLLLVLFQLVARRYRAFVSFGLSYAVILVLARELGWAPPGF